MFAVLLDVMPRDIGAFFDVESVLELTVPDITLKEHFYRELDYLGMGGYKIIKESEYYDNNDIGEYDYIMLLFSYIYYEFSYVNIKEFNKEMLLTDENNNVIGAVICTKRCISSSDVLTQLKTLNIERLQVTEYCKKIENAYDYQTLLADILNNKTDRKLPEIAQGVYTESSIPKGDFTIIPPVYLGENVQIESGSVIGPNTVIMNNCLIAEGSVAVNSIIMKNSYISNDCYVEKSVMCEDTSLCKNSSVFENSVIGCHSIIGENLFIERNTKIKPYLSVSDYAAKENFVDKTSLDAIENDLSPSECVNLGKSLGTLFLNEKTAILTDGKNNSTIMKFALLSGLLSVGAECIDFGVFFNSSIHYFSKYCEIKWSVYLSSNDGKTSVKIYKNNKRLSSSERVIINSLLRAKSFVSCGDSDYKGVRKIRGMQRMYLNFVLMKFTKKISVNPIFKCSDLSVMQFVGYALNKMTISSDKAVKFIMNDDCSRLVVKQDEITFSYRDIIRAVAFYCRQKNIKNDEIWRYDAVYLSFFLIKILGEYNGDMNDLMSITPDYYVADRAVMGKAFMKNIASNFCSDIITVCDDGVFLKNSESFANIKKINDNNLKITVESFNSEVAEELAVELERILRL